MLAWGSSNGVQAMEENFLFDPRQSRSREPVGELRDITGNGSMVASPKSLGIPSKIFSGLKRQKSGNEGLEQEQMH